MNPEILELFCQAVGDVGLWSWWSTSEDGKFQVEFAGAQVFLPPLSPQEPPCNTLALRFEGSVQAVFLQLESCSLPSEWSELLQLDQLRPLRLTPGRLSLTDATSPGSGDSAEWLRQVQRHGQGPTPTAGDLLQRPVRLLMWAGDAGLAVAARRVTLVTHQGDLDWQVFPGLVGQWWSYWRRYWGARNGPQALPWDYACEATVPVEEEEPDVNPL